MYSTNGLTNISNYTTTGLSSSVGTITISGQTIYLSASPNIGGNITLTLNIPNASSSVTGLLTSTDWNTFNGKENVLSFTSPLNRIGNTVSIPQANATTDGYLSSTDWNTFNAGSVDILPLNNSWSGTNTFNNDVTINCNGTGLTGSPKLILSLPDFKTEVNDINNLYRIVETGANKAFYLSRLDNQIYSHYPLNVNDNDYTFTLATTEYLDGCYIYSGVYLTADRTIFLPINTQFATVYGTNYTCSFTILTSTSALNNKRWKIDKTTTSVLTTMYVNQVLQTSYPFFLSLNTPYICEVETFLSGASQILIYNFRSLEKAQVIPNLQQVLTSGNTAASTNLDLTNGILLASEVSTNILFGNTGPQITVISDLFINTTFALDFEGEVLIQKLGTNVIDTSGTTLSLTSNTISLKASDIKLPSIPSATKNNILFYDTGTKSISWNTSKLIFPSTTFGSFLMGDNAGTFSEQSSSTYPNVLIGRNAGRSSLGQIGMAKTGGGSAFDNIMIGNDILSGSTATTGNYAIGLGTQVFKNGAGKASIGIGLYAGMDLSGNMNPDHSIVINATETQQILGIADSTIIKPIKNEFNDYALNYNPTSGELTYYPNVNYLIQSPNQALTNTTNAQNAFSSPYSTFNAQVGTYKVEWTFVATSLSAVSRTLSALWSGTATFNTLRMYYTGGINATLTTNAGDNSVYQTSTGAVVVGSAGAGATARFTGKGIMLITGAGTIIPQIQFGTAAPGATAVRQTGSHIIFTYLNTNNATSFGDWV